MSNPLQAPRPAGTAREPGLDFTRIVIAADARNLPCQQAEPGLRAQLEASGFPTVFARDDCPASPGDLLVVLGGDGFLMRSLAAWGYPSVSVLGLNFGQVGFMMNSPDHLRDLALVVRDRRFHVSEMPILAARVADDEGERDVYAMNDLVLERVSGQTSRLDVFIEGVLLNRYSGDGIIVATAAGSTAYTVAAGGPVVHPAVHAMIVTPVNAHRPIQFHSLQFPLVLPLDSRVEIAVIDRTTRPTRLVADGATVAMPRLVSIASAGRSIHLLRTEEYNYTASLVQKVIGTNGV